MYYSNIYFKYIYMYSKVYLNNVESNVKNVDFTEGSISSFANC